MTRQHISFHMRQYRSQFRQQWVSAFEHSADTSHQMLMTLGAIRCLYWQALGMGLPHVASRIAAWWKAAAYIHRQGELIC